MRGNVYVPYVVNDFEMELRSVAVSSSLVSREIGSLRHQLTFVHGRCNCSHGEIASLGPAGTASLALGGEFLV